MAQGRAPRSNRGASNSGFLLGIIAGLILGLAIALGIAFYLNKTPIPFAARPKPAAGEAQPESAKPIAGMPQGGTPAAAKQAEKPKFTFHDILPRGEEPVSEREFKDRLRAKPAAAPEAAKDTYYVQAGSFQNPADADTLKARVAIIGMESNIERVSLPEKGVWYRVRLGPYSKLEDINRVRQSLAQNGIDANLVKLKDGATAKGN